VVGADDCCFHDALLTSFFMLSSSFFILHFPRRQK
jgi:hypothetical protein